MSSGEVSRLTTGDPRGGRWEMGQNQCQMPPKPRKEAIPGCEALL